MKKKTRKRFVGFTAAAVSIALMLSLSTTALAAGRDYAPQDSEKSTYGSYTQGSCGSGNGPSASFTPEKGNSFDINGLKDLLGKFCGKGSIIIPEKPQAGQPSAPASPAPTASAVPAPAASPSSVPSPSAAPTIAPDSLAASESQMIQLVNSERSKAGVPALTVSADLSNMARVKSQDMINNGYFSHNSPTYGSPFDMMKAFGISFRTAGENIAINQSVDSAHTSLMNSEGHRANILNTAYTQIGIGIAKDSRGNLYITQEFIG